MEDVLGGDAGHQDLGSCVCLGWHRNLGEGDSPTCLGKAVIVVLPGLARLEQPWVRAQESSNTLGTKCTILSGINPLLWIWPVCRCVQWDQHWQGCLQDLKCFSLPGKAGKGHGADGLCLPSVEGGLVSSHGCVGGDVGFLYLSPLKSWMCSQGLPCARELSGLSQTQLQLKIDFSQGHVVIEQGGMASEG